MPYNNAPITPTKEVTGSTALPLARVKKIIHADDDIGACSNNAAFCIAVATELFVRHLVEQAHKVVKSERRPRRNIQYKDIANAVARIDNLEFLVDVVPRTTTYKSYKEKKAAQDAKASEGQALVNGQRTLEDMRGGDGADVEMRDADVEMRDADGALSGRSRVVAPDGSVLVPRSPTISRSSGQKFDAVRNELTESTPMEE